VNGGAVQRDSFHQQKQQQVVYGYEHDEGRDESRAGHEVRPQRHGVDPGEAIQRDRVGEESDA
jgi:hypothetical protein